MVSLVVFIVSLSYYNMFGFVSFPSESILATRSFSLKLLEKSIVEGFHNMYYVFTFFMYHPLFRMLFLLPAMKRRPKQQLVS